MLNSGDVALVKLHAAFGDARGQLGLRQGRVVPKACFANSRAGDVLGLGRVQSQVTIA